MRRTPLARPLALSLAILAAACGDDTTNDPFSDPIEATEGVVVVGFREFATLPDVDGVPARVMRMVHEPATDRFFVNDMRGPVYTVSSGGEEVARYLDVDDAAWGVRVEWSGRERGVQSFALHPDFAVEGAPGYGKLYTWTDTEDMEPEPDFTTGNAREDSHDTLLLEWAAEDAGAALYDGGPPRELLRVRQPFGNHNGGHAAFNPLASPGDADYGLLYLGVADGGSGGDPMDLARNLASAFGKVFRIDPIGSNAANGSYGVPADNPYAADGDDATLGEIYASGVRNPQRFGWDPATGVLYLADIGQNIVEELSPVGAGADLGWNEWEGSFRFLGREAVDPREPRNAPALTYPVAEYDHTDPLFGDRAAITGVVAYRDGAIPQLRDLLLFGDFPSGEVFYVPAPDLSTGGQEEIRRVLLRDGGESRTLLQLIREKNAEQGREPAERVDLRLDTGPGGRLFLTNKHDGTIREIVP